MDDVSMVGDESVYQSDNYNKASRKQSYEKPQFKQHKNQIYNRNNHHMGPNLNSEPFHPFNNTQQMGNMHPQAGYNQHNPIVQNIQITHFNQGPYPNNLNINIGMNPMGQGFNMMNQYPMYHQHQMHYPPQQYEQGSMRTNLNMDFQNSNAQYPQHGQNLNVPQHNHHPPRSQQSIKNSDSPTGQPSLEQNQGIQNPLLHSPDQGGSKLFSNQNGTNPEGSDSMMQHLPGFLNQHPHQGNDESRLARMRGINNPNLAINGNGKIKHGKTEPEFQPGSVGANKKRFIPQLSPLESPMVPKGKNVPFKNFQQNKVNHYSMNSMYKNFVNQHEAPLLGNLHRYVPTHLQDKSPLIKPSPELQQQPQTKPQQPYDIQDRLEKDVFNLLDKDESNNYSPQSSQKRERQNLSDSGYPGTYNSYENKFQLNQMSNANLNSSGTERDTPQKSRKVGDTNSSGGKLRGSGINPSNTNLTDDATLEQIFLEGKNNMFRVSEKKSLNAESFKGSFGELYHGGGGSTNTGHQGFDVDSGYKVGGSLGDPKRNSFGAYNSQRQSHKRNMNQGQANNQHKSSDKKHYQHANSVLSDGKKDYSLDDVRDVDQFEPGKEFDQYQYQDYVGADWLRRSLGAQRNFYEAGEDDLE